MVAGNLGQYLTLIWNSKVEKTEKPLSQPLWIYDFDYKKHYKNNEVHSNDENIHNSKIFVWFETNPKSLSD